MKESFPQSVKNLVSQEIDNIIVLLLIIYFIIF